MCEIFHIRDDSPVAEGGAPRPPVDRPAVVRCVRPAAMAVCSKCGLPFSYTEPHRCEGRDRTKLWSLASVAVGAVGGGVGGAWLGLAYGHSLMRAACQRPDATNLCGLSTLPAIPFYVVIGAVIGASIAAFAIVVTLRRRRA